MLLGLGFTIIQILVYIYLVSVTHNESRLYCNFEIWTDFEELKLIVMVLEWLVFTGCLWKS